MSPTTRRQGLRRIGPLPTLCTYLQPWRSTAHGLCRLPTASVLSNKADKITLQSVLINKPNFLKKEQADAGRDGRTCLARPNSIVSDLHNHTTNASRRPLRAMQTVLCKRPLTTYNLYRERDCCTIHIAKATDVFSSHDCIFHVEQVPTD